MKPDAACCVVGISASAGGITALQILFRVLPADPNLALVIIQHMPPGQPNRLMNLINRWSALPV